VAVLDRFEGLEEGEAGVVDYALGGVLGSFWESCGFSWESSDSAMVFFVQSIWEACVRWDGGLLLPRKMFFTLLHI
jgi:hypothetical protein